MAQSVMPVSCKCDVLGLIPQNPCKTKQSKKNQNKIKQKNGQNDAHL